MPDSDREREMLREVLAEGHRASGRRTPPFAALWARATAEAGSPHRARRPVLAVAAVAAVLVLAATITLWNVQRQSQGELERAMTIATAVGEWQAPLDFLLETPGREWLETPRWSPRPGTELGLTPTLLEPDSQQPASQQEIAK